MELAKNLKFVRERIERAACAAGRDPNEVTLLVVSKFVPFEVMELAYNLGVRAFGESYVQEAKPKYEAFKALNAQVELQLVGKLQRNKVKRAAGMFSIIQSLDRQELVLDLATAAVTRSVRQGVLIQVNISNESTKGGVRADGVRKLVEMVLEFPNLDLQGLMAIGSPISNESETTRIRKEFAFMREMLLDLRKEFCLPLPVLSMGTSEDFELAIEEGSTLVRVGSAIFGDRQSYLS